MKSNPNQTRIELHGFYHAATWTKLPLLWLQWPFVGVLVMLACMVVLRPTLGCKDVDKNGIIIHESSVLCPRGFQLGDSERKIMFALSILGVFNVARMYTTSTGAKRHRVQLKGNQVLGIHLLSGTITALGTGLASILGGVDVGGKAFWFFAVNDLVHQFAFILLMKNHDGIYALRVGSMTALLLKFSAILNHRYHTRYVTDLLFQPTFSFAATRLSATIALLAIRFVFGSRSQSFRREDWYSIGMSIAQFHQYIRIPDCETVALLALPLTSFFYYHELWRRSWRLLFTGFNLIYAAICIRYMSTPHQRYISLFLYYLLTALPPRFYRSPETAISDAVAKVMGQKRRRVVLNRKERLFG